MIGCRWFTSRWITYSSVPLQITLSLSPVPVHITGDLPSCLLTLPIIFLWKISTTLIQLARFLKDGTAVNHRYLEQLLWEVLLCKIVNWYSSCHTGDIKIQQELNNWIYLLHISVKFKQVFIFQWDFSDILVKFHPNSPKSPNLCLLLNFTEISVKFW